MIGNTIWWSRSTTRQRLKRYRSSYPRGASNWASAGQARRPAHKSRFTASRFAWPPGDDRQYDLVVTLDDATAPKTVPQLVSPRRIELGISGSSPPPGTQI